MADADTYVKDLARDVASGRFDLRGRPWVAPSDPFHEARALNAQRRASGEPLIDASEALHLALRPSVFVWAPEWLDPTLRLRCPKCTKPTARAEFAQPRVLHNAHGHDMYIASRHTCYSCTGGRPSVEAHPPRSRNPKLRKRPKRTFMADSPEMLRLLPAPLQGLWDFVSTGRNICDTSVVDLARAMATRASWAAITDAINEAKHTTWVKSVVLRYLQLCEELRIQPRHTPSVMPSAYALQEKWLRNLFLLDARRRLDGVARELASEKGDDILIVDWTCDAASRCTRKFLFNVMSGRGKVLLSRFTETCSPNEAEPLVLELKRRGVDPKVAYVDNWCCGAWQTILTRLWPAIKVRLDGMHAIRRLTQTTTSTDHPWHGDFCVMLSEALYTYDAGEVERLRRARVRDGHADRLPHHVRNKFVPRYVKDAPRILTAMDAAIETFKGRAHEQMGELLTPRTLEAWENLKEHVRAGCLCDPPGLNLHKRAAPILIGGEDFWPIRTTRGASCLEGFHTHQKHWLGPLARHAPEAGSALLADGALRWNRKRDREATPTGTNTPPVFAEGLLEDANDIHRRLAGGRNLYANNIEEKSLLNECNHNAGSRRRRWRRGILSEDGGREC